MEGRRDPANGNDRQGWKRRASEEGAWGGWRREERERERGMVGRGRRVGNGGIAGGEGGFWTGGGNGTIAREIFFTTFS